MDSFNNSIRLNNKIAVLFLVVILAACQESNINGKIIASSHITTTNLSLTNNIDKIDLTWGAVSGIKSYTVYWSTNSNFSTSVYAGKKSGITTNQVSLTTSDGLSNGTAYYFFVAFDKDGIANGQSNTIQASIQVSSSNISITGSSSIAGQIDLNWTQINGTSSMYKVYWSTDSASTVNTLITTATTAGAYKDVTGNTTSINIGTIKSDATTYFVVTYTGGSPVTTLKSTIFTINSKKLVINTIASTETGKIRLTLEASAVANKYTIYWNKTGFATSAAVAAAIASGAMKTTTSTTIDIGINELKANGPHYFVATLTAGTTESVMSNVKNITPKKIKFTAMSSEIGTIDLAWSSVAIADSYTIYWSETSNLNLANITAGTVSGGKKTLTTTSTSLSINDLKASGIHYFILTYTASTIESLPSTEQNATPRTLAITNTTTPSSGIINLTWDSVPIKNKYSLYWGDSAGFTVSEATAIVAGTIKTNIINNSTTISLGDLRSTNTKYFKVSYATVNGTESTASPAANNKVRPITALAVATNPSAQGGGVKLSWPAISQADSYSIYWRDSNGTYDTTVNGGTKTKLIPNTSTTVSGTTLTMYNFVSSPIVAKYITVKYNMQGSNNIIYQSAASNEVSLSPTQLSISADNTPANLVGGVTLNWNAIAGADSYKVHIGTTTGVYSSSQSVTTNTAKITLPKIKLGVVNYFAIKYVKGGNESALSQEVSALPIYANLSKTGSNQVGGVQLNWNNSIYADSYQLIVSGASTTVSKVVTGTSKILVANTSNSIEMGKTYNFTLSINGLGTNGVISNAIIDTPSKFKLTAVSSTSNITFNWQLSPLASSQTLHWRTSAGGTVVGTKVFSSNVSSAVLTTATTTTTGASIVANQNYYFTVNYSTTDGVESTHSTEIQSALNLIPVTNLKATSHSGGIDLTWDAVSGYNNYYIYSGTSAAIASGKPAGTTTTSTTSDNKVTLSSNDVNYIPGTTVYFVVTRILVGALETAPSNQVSAAAGLSPPSNLSATNYFGTVLLKWIPPSGTVPDGYDLYYATSSFNITTASKYVSGGIPVFNITTGTSGSNKTYKFNGLPNTKYHFTIIAVKGFGKSNPSLEITGTPEGDMRCGTNVNANPATITADGTCFDKTIKGSIRGCNFLE